MIKATGIGFRVVTEVKKITCKGCGKVRYVKTVKAYPEASTLRIKSIKRMN